MVDTLNSGRARDAILATCARNILFLAAMFNFTLVASHVYGIALLTISENYSNIPNPIWVDTNLDLTLLNHSI